MSLYGALFSGVSGLTAQSSSMGAIADNIANVNTIGYKGSQVNFQTFVTRQSFSTKYAPGGVQSKIQSGIDVEGMLQASTRASDLGLAGQGFFVVADSAENPQNFVYSRAGSFRLDQNGFLKNIGGYYMQGWPLEMWDGNTSAETVVQDGQTYMKAYKNEFGDTYYINDKAIDSTNMRPINLTNIGGTARATSLISYGANLPSGAKIGAQETSNARIFDSLGNEHQLQFSYMKRDTNAWDFEFRPPAGSTASEIRDQKGGSYFGAGRLDFTTRPAPGTSLRFGVGGKLYDVRFESGPDTNGGFVDIGPKNNSVTIAPPPALPQANDKITIGGVEFTLKNGPTTAPNEIDISGITDQDAMATRISEKANTYFNLAFGPGNWTRTNPGGQILSSLEINSVSSPNNGIGQPAYTSGINPTPPLPPAPPALPANGTFVVSSDKELSQILDDLAKAINTMMAFNMNDGTGKLPPNPPGNLAARVKGENGIWYRQFSENFDITMNASNVKDATPGGGKPAVIQKDPKGVTVPKLSSPVTWVNGGNALTFNGDGSIDKILGYDETSAVDPRLKIHMGWANGALDMNDDVPANGGSPSMTWFLGNYNFKDGMQQMAGKFTENYYSQNGNRFGLFASLSIGEDGIVNAHFDNGVITPIFMIPVATFANVNGLLKLSGNVFQQSDTSGLPSLRESGNGGAGVITQSTLESSTVDLGEEFTTMITTQRAYSAAAKIITTSDQMLDELIMIKR